MRGRGVYTWKSKLTGALIWPFLNQLSQGCIPMWLCNLIVIQSREGAILGLTPLDNWWKTIKYNCSWGCELCSRTLLLWVHNSGEYQNMFGPSVGPSSHIPSWWLDLVDGFSWYLVDLIISSSSSPDLEVTADLQNSSKEVLLIHPPDGNYTPF